MTKSRDCLDWVSFWRIALAAVLAIVFAAAASPCWADDGIQPVKLTESDFTKFWADTGIRQFYGYGMPVDLSNLYEFFSALERENPRFTNPMKSMVMVDGRGYWAENWDYLAEQQVPKAANLPRYCTDFVAGLILLRLLSFDDAVRTIEGNPALLCEWTNLWDAYAGQCISIISQEIQPFYPEAQCPFLFLEKGQSDILYRVLRLYFQSSYMDARNYALATPLLMPFSEWDAFIKDKAFAEFLAKQKVE